MPRRLTAADRSALIRLASTLPAGSPERRAIIASLWEVTDRGVVDPNVGDTVTVQDVDKVLSALITGPGWDSRGVTVVEREALSLARQGYGLAVLMGILGWIDNESDPTPGMAHAQQVISHIGRRIGRPIRPSNIEEAGYVQGFLSNAYVA